MKVGSYLSVIVSLRLNKFLVHSIMFLYAQADEVKYLVFGKCSNNEGAHHSRQCTYSIRDAHKNTGIARSYVKMVYIESCVKEYK